MAISAPRMIALLATVATFAVAAAPAHADGEVNIYSSRHYDTDERLYSDFTEATGIKINLIEGKEDDLRLVVTSPGEVDLGAINLPEGAYVFYCDIAGHRGLGMEGNLYVLDSGQ